MMRGKMCIPQVLSRARPREARLTREPYQKKSSIEPTCQPLIAPRAANRFSQLGLGLQCTEKAPVQFVQFVQIVHFVHRVHSLKLFKLKAFPLEFDSVPSLFPVMVLISGFICKLFWTNCHCLIHSRNYQRTNELVMCPVGCLRPCNDKLSPPL